MPSNELDKVRTSDLLVRAHNMYSHIMSIVRLSLIMIQT
jgi:hypothetical protein